MYATELKHQLNTMRQHILFTQSGTLLEPEKLPPDQKHIIAQMCAASLAIYGHVMMQMTLDADESKPSHTRSRSTTTGKAARRQQSDFSDAGPLPFFQRMCTREHQDKR